METNPVSIFSYSSVQARLLGSLVFLLSVTVVFSLSSSVSALTPQQRGLEIAKESKQRDIGWGNSSADMTMTLRNKEGQESVRQMRLKALEQMDDGDKSLTVFDQPRDVKGTAFLSFSHVETTDDQWLYLPALKRVKRISSRNKSGPFMGSEFSFEDMSSFEVEKYDYNYLRDEVVSGVDSYVVEQVPVDNFSGYTRRIVWIDKEHYRVQKVDFYDRKDSLLKTLTLSEYQQYLGRHWRPHHSKMSNHQSGKVTILEYAEIKFGVGLSERDFNKNSLKRAR